MPRIAQGPRNLGRRGRRSRRYSPTPHPGLSALRGAEFFIDATLSGVSGGKLLNIGTGGSALDAQFGSTTGTDTNDPTLLVHSGTNYLYLPGVNGNGAQVPSNAAYDITGDIELVVRANLNAQALSNAMLSKPATYRFIVDGTDATKMKVGRWSGAVWNEVSSSTGLLVTGPRWYRIRRVQSTGTCTWESAPDQTVEPTSWTSFGSAGLDPGSPFPTLGGILEMGARDAGFGVLDGGLLRVILRNGISGTTVLDADFTRGITSGGQTTFTESSSNAATVTINRSTSGRKSVAVVRNVLLLGTDDYLEVADNALLDFDGTGNETMLVIMRQWGTPVASAAFMSKRDTAAAVGPNWGMIQFGSAFAVSVQAGNGVNFQTLDFAAPTWAAGALTSVAAVRSVAAVTPYVNGTAGTPQSFTTAAGDMTNAVNMRIGRHTTGGNVIDMEFVAAAVFRRALTAAEIASIVAYYQAA